jgi:hypothetical protein
MAILGLAHTCALSLHVTDIIHGLLLILEAVALSTVFINFSHSWLCYKAIGYKCKTTTRELQSLYIVVYTIVLT